MSQTVGSQGLDAETIKGLLDGSYGEATPPGWRKDGKLSTNQQKVYVHEETGKVVVSHRGTVGTAQDWFNNAVYGAFGDKGYELTGRYKKAKKTQKKAEKKYGAENISTIGHSQGGLLAQKVGGDSAEIITLNKATRPQDFFKRKRGEKQTDIRTEGDVVSMFKNPYETQGEQVTIKTDKFNPLAEHATDVLDRMKADKAADQAPEWSTSGRPPGTMISRVGRLISKSFFGRGPRTLEEMQGGNEHDDPEFETERDEVLQGSKYALPREMLAQILYRRQERIDDLKFLLEGPDGAAHDRELERDDIDSAGEAKFQNRMRRIEEGKREGKFGRIGELQRKILATRSDPAYRDASAFSDNFSKRFLRSDMKAYSREPDYRYRYPDYRYATDLEAMRASDEFYRPERANRKDKLMSYIGPTMSLPERKSRYYHLAKEGLARKERAAEERGEPPEPASRKRRRQTEVARMSRAVAQRGLRDKLLPDTLGQIDEFARRSNDPPSPNYVPTPTLTPWVDPAPFVPRLAPGRSMSRATAEYLVRDRPNLRIPGGIRVREPYPGVDI